MKTQTKTKYSQKEIDKLLQTAILVSGAVFFIIGLLLGLAISNNYVSKDSAQEWGQKMFNEGYNECRDKWINSVIGLDGCYYETNQNNTMVRYVCGNLTNGWRKI
jgi:preprotein translocase subunit SecG